MDTLFFNGMFYLGDHKWSPGFLIDRAGLITKIFSSAAEITTYSSPNIRSIDMRGAYILPGFEDAHTHPAVCPIMLDMLFDDKRVQDSIATIDEKLADENMGAYITVLVRKS